MILRERPVNVLLFLANAPIVKGGTYCQDQWAKAFAAPKTFLGFIGNLIVVDLKPFNYASLYKRLFLNVRSIFLLLSQL